MSDTRANLQPTGMTLLHAPGRRMVKLITATDVVAYDSFKPKYFDLHSVAVQQS